MTVRSISIRAATVLAVAARVALGALWVHEGVVKVRAGFGAADIRLISDGASSNTRIPDFFAFGAEHVLDPAAPLFGVIVQVWELGLGAALILGIRPRWAALASGLTLAVYWMSDQLIWQYPVMAILSLVVLTLGEAAQMWAITTARLGGGPAPRGRARGPRR